MPTIFIDNIPHIVSGKNNLLQQCLSLGFNLPYFCWHPALGSVGACRQCAVVQYRNEQDTHGHIVMACMTALKDGMRISIEDEQAKNFRSRIIEWLMTNHPHDCPVCDEGGECHLQDMTVMSGHTYRKYQFEKRTYTNQDLGPFINHEMNRCITCYRCVRFYNDYAGGKDLQAFASKNHVYFGRHSNGALESEFSGNLVEVCPTGVFTDKTLKSHFTRKWDLQSAPAVCAHCATGCNIFSSERYGSLRRILNRYNHHVNGYFICDRGRFGYEFANGEKRVRNIFLHDAMKTRQCLTLQQARHWLSGSRGHQLLGIGSPRASIESNFALRTLVGKDNFFDGLSDTDSTNGFTIADVLQHGSASTPTLPEIESSDAVLILGEDISNTAPRIALAARRSIWQNAYAYAQKLQIPPWMDGVVRDAAGYFCAQLWEVTPNTTRLDDIANTRRLPPVEIARLGYAIAHAIDPKAPDVNKLSADSRQYAQGVAQALKSARRPLIICGTGCSDPDVIKAAANIAKALATNENTRLYYALAECNHLGLALLRPRPLSQAFQTLKESRQPITAVILENSLSRRAPQEDVEVFLKAVKRVVWIDYLDHSVTDTDINASHNSLHSVNTDTTPAKCAQIHLPAAVFAESTGTLVSAEGRMQRFFSAMPFTNDVKPGWQWCAEIWSIIHPDKAPKWKNLEDVMTQCADQIPLLNRITEAALQADFRIHGCKVPRSPHRYSGRTAMHAHKDVHEPRPPQDPDSPLAYTMEGYPLPPPEPLIPFYWAAGWNSIQSSHFYQREVGDALNNRDSGTRLFSPDNTLTDYFSKIPPPFQRKGINQWLLVPLHFIFGSEELSALSPSISQLAPSPFIAVNEQDARVAAIGDGEEVIVCIHGKIRLLPCRIEPALPAYVAGLPAGLVEFGGMPLPAWITIESPRERRTDRENTLDNESSLLSH